MTRRIYKSIKTVLLQFMSRRAFTYLLALMGLFVVLLCAFEMQLSTKEENTEGSENVANLDIAVATNINNINEDVSDVGEMSRPWYMTGGTRRPLPVAKNRISGRRMARVWPEEYPGSDRITNQLMFVPPSALAGESSGQSLKKILFYYGLNRRYNLNVGRKNFIEQRCPVDTCTITLDKNEATDADAIVYYGSYDPSPDPRPPRQVWLLYVRESPFRTRPVETKDMFNWTISYRRDSDLPVPNKRWVYYDERVQQNAKLDRNYAANKKKKVAWLVSNCHDSNNREKYAHELQKYIPVDIYGKCGPLKCPRSKKNECFEMLDRDYKFYLAFENANCKDYITEKLLVNSLGHNVLPIVMGARPEEYALVAPYRSYIHVEDFESPKELAAYLHRLDTDDDLYNSYFRWKGTGEFLSSVFFYCRLCAMLHDDFPNKFYPDINNWYRGPGICTDGTWRDVEKILKYVPGL